MVFSAMIVTFKKVLQFGVLVFLEAQEINLWGKLQGSKCDGYFILLWEHFSFYEKLLSLLTLKGFFKYFYSNPWWYFQLTFISQ